MAKGWLLMTNRKLGIRFFGQNRSFCFSARSNEQQTTLETAPQANW
jgi:hypothetical protein